MADSNDLLRERVKLVAEIKRIQEKQGIEAAKLDDAYIKIKGRLQEILKIEETTIAKREQVLGIIKETEETTSNLSSVYALNKKQVSDQLLLQQKLVSSIGDQLNRGNEISTSNIKQSETIGNIIELYSEQANIATKLAQLSDEDAIDRSRAIEDIKSISSEIENQVALLDNRTNVAKEFVSIQGEIEESIREQVKLAKEQSSLSKDQKAVLEEQAAAMDFVRDKIDSFGSTITSFLQRPQTAIGATLVFLGHLEHKISDVNKKLGFTILDMNSAAKSAGVLSLIFDDTVGTVKALTNEFGTLESATLGTQFNIGAMSSLMGISNTEASKLVGQFARINGGSTDIAADMVQTTKEYAKQNNVIPSQVLADLAGNAEAFAIFAKEGGKNMIEAATGARKLGTDLGTVAGIADSLLDFETSMVKEMELSAMLGKSINLNKARQLAYDGDILAATQETLKQVGGIESFNRMDYYQKKQTADLLGVSVAELQKMADNQENIGSMGQVVQEKFSKWEASLNLIVNKYLGTGITALGGWIGAGAQFGAQLSMMGLPLGNMVKSTGQVLKNLLGMVAGPIINGLKSIGGAMGGSSLGKAGGSLKDRLMKGVGKNVATATDANSKMPAKKSGLEGLSKGLSKMGTQKVLFGALNLVPTALGMVAMIPAIPGMIALSLLGTPTSVGLIALGKGLSMFGKSVSKALPQIGIGLLVLAGFGAAMIPLAYALSLTAPAIEAFGTVITSVFNGMGTLVTAVAAGFVTLMDSVTLEKVTTMALLGPALFSIAAGLSAVGVAGLMALPALAGLTLAGPALSMIADITGVRSSSETTTAVADGSLSEYETKMLEKMDTLIKAVNSNRDVYLDKEKVTSVVRKGTEKATGNMFGLNVA